MIEGHGQILLQLARFIARAEAAFNRQAAYAGQVSHSVLSPGAQSG